MTGKFSKDVIKLMLKKFEERMMLVQASESIYQQMMSEGYLESVFGGNLLRITQKGKDFLNE